VTARAQSGMTLLETLIALVILSLAIIAAMSMTSSARVLNAAAQKRQQNIENAYALSFLTAQFENIAPAVREIRNGVPILDFYGSQSEMRFVSASRSEAETPALQRTAIRTADGKLVIGRNPLTADSRASERELLTTSGKLKFQYGDRDADGRIVFYDSWVDRDRHPALIVVTIESAAPGDSQTLLAAVPMLSTRY